MYFIGIDISKFKHDCAIIDEAGDTVTASWSFANNCEGFSLLKQLLDALDGQKKIGFESTGHYGHNLKLFLETNNFSPHTISFNSAPNSVSAATMNREVAATTARITPVRFVVSAPLNQVTLDG